MGLRVSPSIIDLYIHEKFVQLDFGKAGELLRSVRIRLPRGAGSLISSSLTPILELLVAHIFGLARDFRDETNEYRKFHSQYELIHPRYEHYDKAARLVTNGVLKYIKENSFNKLGGEQKGETKQPREPSESTDP